MKLDRKQLRLAFLFIEFLHNRRDFYEFMENFTGAANSNSGVSLYSYLSLTLPTFFVSNAFSFHKTKQGFDYWMAVSIAWNTFLINKINKL